MKITNTAACALALAASLAACGGGSATPPEARAAVAPTAHALAAAAPQPQGGCPAGAVLAALTPDAGQARDGSVFSATLYDPTIESGNTTHQPRKLKVRVTLGGQPVQGCAVNWLPRDNGNADKDGSGWVFPDAPTTDFNGIASAWWTAGRANRQTLDVGLRRADGSAAAVEIRGQSRGHVTRANSIHVSWKTPADRKSVV